MDLMHELFTPTQSQRAQLGFGCMSLPSERNQSVRMLHRAMDEGITFFDTADLYGQGNNERTLGEAFRGRRDRVRIATKVGNRFTEGDEGWTWDSSRAYILSAVRQSLKRLETDYIDLYQLHGGTMEDPIDETIDAFKTLQREGLIREFGISSMRLPVVETFAHAGIASVQLQYNLLDRRAEESLLPLCMDKGVAVIVRGPLANGLLTGRFTRVHTPADTDRRSIGHAGLPYDTVMDHLDRFISVGATHGRTMQEAALQFVLSHPAVAVTIPGARTIEQLETNVAAGKSPPMSEMERRSYEDDSNVDK